MDKAAGRRACTGKKSPRMSRSCLCLFWRCVGVVLVMSRSCLGVVLVMSRSCLDVVLVMSRSGLGRVPVFFG